MKHFLATIIVLSLTPLVSAQEVSVHVHNKTCLTSGSCRITPIAPQVPIVRGADLGRLEATTMQIATEQRYQTHVLYGIQAQLQRMADLQLLAAAQQAATAQQQGNNEIRPTPIPGPDQVRPTPIPLPSQVQPTYIPLPSQVQPTEIPVPIRVNPSVIPGPGFGGGTQIGGPNSSGPPTATAPPLPMRHISWPQVQRSK